jgi:hypothetical protein
VAFADQAATPSQEKAENAPPRAKLTTAGAFFDSIGHKRIFSEVCAMSVIPPKAEAGRIGMSVKGQRRTWIAESARRLGSFGDDLKILGGDAGGAIGGLVVPAIEVLQIASKCGLRSLGETSECPQSRTILEPVKLDRFRNREWKFYLP